MSRFCGTHPEWKSQWWRYAPACVSPNRLRCTSKRRRSVVRRSDTHYTGVAYEHGALFSRGTGRRWPSSVRWPPNGWLRAITERRCGQSAMAIEWMPAGNYRTLTPPERALTPLQAADPLRIAKITTHAENHVLDISRFDAKGPPSGSATPQSAMPPNGCPQPITER